MHSISPHDGGRTIDWSKASDDYADYRPGYPDSFYRRLAALEVARPGQHVLDLATGTGNLARRFAAAGCRVTAVDIAPRQIEAARRLASADGVEVDLKVARAEETGLPDATFDLITAGQCWLYFDQERMIAEVKRLLSPGGRLMTCHFCWLPRLDRVARESEALVLKHNPDWTAGDWAGEIPAMPTWAPDHFELAAMFWYDEPIPFSRESWRGRIRACRGVGASLSADAVAAFDRDHAALLERIAEPQFTILHRIDAHILRPRTT